MERVACILVFLGTLTVCLSDPAAVNAGLNPVQVATGKDKVLGRGTVTVPGTTTPVTVTVTPGSTPNTLVVSAPGITPTPVAVTVTPTLEPTVVTPQPMLPKAPTVVLPQAVPAKFPTVVTPQAVPPKTPTVVTPQALPAKTPTVVTPQAVPATTPTVVTPQAVPATTPTVVTPQAVPATTPTVVTPQTKTPTVVPAAVTPVVKQQPVATGACPASKTVCDLWYGPTAVKVDLQPSTINKVVSTQQIFTKGGRPVTSIAAGPCAVIGEPKTTCESFGFLPANPGDLLTSLLGTFPMGPDVTATLKGKCIKLGVTNFGYDGKWVNVNDNNPEFPAERRCLLIQT